MLFINLVLNVVLIPECNVNAVKDDITAQTVASNCIQALGSITASFQENNRQENNTQPPGIYWIQPVSIYIIEEHLGWTTLRNLTEVCVRLLYTF